ncbi:MAG: response regulator [archaeon]|nr:response regulator [archaeon]
MGSEEFNVTYSNLGSSDEESRGKILVVDDIEMNLVLLEEILSDQDFNVKTTSDPKKVIKLAESFDPDIILLDLIMPDIDGFSLLNQIKNNPSLKYCEVIIVTAKSDPKDIGKAYDLGGYDYIKKPYNNIELLIRVRGAIRLKKTLDEQRIIKKQLEFMNKTLLNQKIQLTNENLNLKGKLEEFSGKFETQEMDGKLESVFEPGNVYLYYEPKLKHSIEQFIDHLKHRYAGLMITRSYPDEIKEKFKITNTPIFWINTILKGIENNSIGPQQIQEIIYLIKNFLKSNKNREEKFEQIIILDGIEQLITYNSFNTFLRFLGSLYDLGKINKCIILISANKDSFTIKERALIEGEVYVMEKNEKN